MLNDAKIKAAKAKDKPYRLGDSGQLYLYVSTAGGRHWRMNYTYGVNAQGKPAQKTLSFGSYPDVTLVAARKEREDAKAILAAGRDPAVERRLREKAKASENENTFRAIGERWFELKSGWSLKKFRDWLAQYDRKWTIGEAGNWTVRRGGWVAKHSKRVWESLTRDVFPEIGAMPINSIDAPRLLELLSKVEARDAIETAHRVRQRVSAIFVYGIAAGIAKSDPAASLGKVLTPKPRAKPQPAIIDGLRTNEQRITAIRQLMIDCEAERARALTKLAQRFLALTAVRSGEQTGARWAELEDWKPRWGIKAGERVRVDRPLWRIPAARMKGDDDRKHEADGDHLVPLSWQAVDVLLALEQLTGGLDLIFPSDRHVHRPMSDATLTRHLEKAGYKGRHVPHGFRATFSTIMNERAKAAGIESDRAIIDLMLAHVPKDRVESAYNRADFMDRRRELAQEWADILMGDFWPAEAHLGQPMRHGVGK